MMPQAAAPRQRYQSRLPTAALAHSIVTCRSPFARGSFIAMRTPSVFVTYAHARPSLGTNLTIWPPAPPQPNDVAAECPVLERVRVSEELTEELDLVVEECEARIGRIRRRRGSEVQQRHQGPGSGVRR